MRLFLKITIASFLLLFLPFLFSFVQRNIAYISSMTAVTADAFGSQNRSSDARPPDLVVIKPPQQATSTIKVLIGGDIMLDRENRMIGEKSGYDSLFAGISPLLHQADISIANLEGTITTYPSRTLMANDQLEDILSFTFDTKTAAALSHAGITSVSLANNHTNNFGKSGIDQTRNWLGSAGVGWFGDPFNIGPEGSSTPDLKDEDASSTADIICRKGICLAFVGYHEFEPGFDRILADVSRLAAEGYPVIVMPHWGDEYAEISPERVKEKARELVDAGAFAIIGAHPHVTEDREWIQGVPVIYSLGNLVFDQYFSPQVMSGDMVELMISAVPGTDSGAMGFSAPPQSAHIDSVQIFTVSNTSHKGPVVEGSPIDF